MSFWIDVTLAALACLLLVPILIFCLECGLALPPRSRRSTPAAIHRTASRPRVAIIIPAFNEEVGILATLRAVSRQLRAGDRLIVVADNCTDSTASLAQGAGCEVVHRTDPTRRGKGYALDAGVRHIEAAGARPLVVIVFDADCIPMGGCVTTLATRALDTGRPVQASYLMGLPDKPLPGSAVSALAVLVKNFVRPRGLHRIGMPCMLTGTGMAFPWEILRKTPLASGDIVEDMKLGIDLALAGHAPTFCEEARVLGRLPAGAAATKSQRRRWEHGHLRTLLSQGPRLLWHGIFGGHWLALALLAELCVPPLSLLVILSTLAAGVTAGAMITMGASHLPATLLTAALACVVACVVASWLRFGRRAMPVGSVLGAPRYALAKVPLYASFVRRRQREWVRTHREDKPIDPLVSAVPGERRSG